MSAWTVTVAGFKVTGERVEGGGVLKFSFLLSLFFIISFDAYSFNFFSQLTQIKT